MSPKAFRRHPARDDRGQILVIFALGLITLIAGVALVIDVGVAYAQQRGTQNGSDAAANAGAVVLAQRLGGATKTDADVANAIIFSAGVNAITQAAYYTNVSGQPIDTSGNVATPSNAAVVGASGAIPPNAQGVHVGGTRTFGTTFARVIGISSMSAGAEATAVTGRLIGGAFLPVIFPVNITDCAGNGNLGLPKDQWPISQPGAEGQKPTGTEYIVPLCKTGGGSFQILDLDPDQKCDDEVRNPPPIQWDTFPVNVQSDNGNDCAKKMADAVNELQGKVVLIPICDTNDCNTDGGNNAVYHVSGVAAFYIDYMSYSNKKNDENSLCQSRTSSSGQVLQTISGNGSSSCLAGWFMHFITKGPVGTGAVGNGDAIGIQLIK